MQVLAANDVKIYNLSAGKSLPDWISERKRRTLVNKDVDLQRRIELIQDFEMPTVSHRIKVSRDGQYVLAAGTYKPRIRCYDVTQMSLKFDRCMNSEVIQFELLNDDYTKIVLLHDDRYVEFHNKGGFHYQCRIPCFGRDIAYHSPSCDLYLVGVSDEVYRLNLELGRFLAPLKINSSTVNTCQINPEHQLFTIGTADGTVEIWDPRSKNREGLLDTNLSMDGQHEITVLSYKDGVNLALGTSTGKVMLYDIRSHKPYQLKEHEYGMPINSIDFNTEQDFVLSADSKILKIWQRQTGKLFTYIQPETETKNFCVYPSSGLVFFATEAPKMYVYYIPELGPAPRWCGFLDNLTEELEEDQQPTVYEDYKFVTIQELESLGLSHLIGTNLLRAYMHGFFIDIRLYHRAKAIVEPFAFNEYRKQRIKQQLESQRENRVQKEPKLPIVNKQLAQKLMEKKSASNLEVERDTVQNPLGDNRFKKMFTDNDFQIDDENEDYKRLHPVISKYEEQKKEETDVAQRKAFLQQFTQVEDQDMESSSSGSDDELGSDSDTERMKTSKHDQRSDISKKELEADKIPTMYEIKHDTNVPYRDSAISKGKEDRAKKMSLGRRAELEASASGDSQLTSYGGAKQMTFTLGKDKNQLRIQEQQQQHLKERKKVRRSAASILPKEKKSTNAHRKRGPKVI